MWHWPIIAALVVLGVALWLFTTAGCRQVFFADMLGAAYDSQAEHFLRGDVDVDGAAIQHEAMIVSGKTRMYFGPFPAFLRLPLNLVYPAGRGRWSRISVFCAAMVALGAFAGLTRHALAKSLSNETARAWLTAICLIGFAFASPLLLFLGEPSIYNEAVIWGLAGSIAALFFAYRSRETTGARQTQNFFAFSLSAGTALLARLTFGVPLLVVAALLIPRSPPRARNLLALLLPLAAAVSFHVLLSYARFGSIVGVNYDYYINSTHRDFARSHGILNLARVPPALAHYFSRRPPSLQKKAPFFLAERHTYGMEGPGALTSLPMSETYLSVPWCSAWLVAGALGGAVFLLFRGGADSFDRVVVAALVVQCLAILAYFAIAQRYTADFYPLLIALFAVFLRHSGALLWRLRYVLIALVVISMGVNTLTTISWLTECDQNVPRQTIDAWNRALGR